MGVTLIRKTNNDGLAIAAFFASLFCFVIRFWQRPTVSDLHEERQKVEALNASIREIKELIADLQTKKCTLLR